MSVAVIHNAAFNVLVPSKDRRGGRTNELMTILQNIGLTPDDVRTLDYLFISHYNEEIGHHVLMGVAPKQGFCFSSTASTLNTIEIIGQL